MRFGSGFIVLKVYIHRFVDWSCVTKASIFRLEFAGWHRNFQIPDVGDPAGKN